MASLFPPGRQQHASAVSPDVLMEEGSDRETFSDLDAVSFRELLDQDPRPAFVIDMDSDHYGSEETKESIRPMFCNAALRLHDRLLDKVLGIGPDIGTFDQQAYNKFKSWTCGVSKFDKTRDVFPQTFLHEGMVWTGMTIRQRWRIISGIQWHDASLHTDRIVHRNNRVADKGVSTNYKKLIRKHSTSDIIMAIEQPPKRMSPDSTRNDTQRPTMPTGNNTASSTTTLSGRASNDTAGSSASVQLASPEKCVPDWTVARPQGQLTEHVMFARNVNWGNTPLGPLEKWSVQFREVANLVMRNPHPAALFWGEELTMLYNEAYKNEVAGKKHPELMGTSFSGPFKELWDGLAPIFRECARTGQSVRKENDYLPIERYGYLEETFFSWSFTPVYGGTDRILGFYNAPFETTYQTISQRRLRTLRQVGDELAKARSIKNFWRCVLDGLQGNPYEIPFALRK